MSDDWCVLKFLWRNDGGNVKYVFRVKTPSSDFSGVVYTGPISSCKIRGDNLIKHCCNLGILIWLGTSALKFIFNCFNVGFHWTPQTCCRPGWSDFKMGTATNQGRSRTNDKFRGKISYDLNKVPFGPTCAVVRLFSSETVKNFICKM